MACYNTVGFFTLWFLCYFTQVFCIEDYCSKNTYDNNDNYMHFSKEATFEEFAVAGKFKGLHCCAKGYRSIEWYKDDKLYPWALQVSHLILFPESANQTIYTKSVWEDDAGNYTCVLKNGTVIHSHTIHLKVFENMPDDPKVTYVSKNTKLAIGQSLRLFCEGFTGQVDLPDAHSETYWRKLGANNSVYDVPKHVQQLKNNREDGQTFGTYLMIQNVRREDFGQYVCIISKPGKTIERYVLVEEKVEDEIEYHNPNPIPIGKMILIASAILCCGIIIVILYIQFGLKFQVRLKDSFSSVEDNDGNINDVLLVYSSQDSEIASGVLLPTLQDRYHYKCVSMELPKNMNMWYTSLKEEAQKCRRIIAVFSPTLLGDNWETNNIMQALKQLQSLGPKLICVSLKEFPKNQVEFKNSQGETLCSLTRSIGVVLWERKIEDKFWYSLRLRLPPKRSSDHLETKKPAQIENEPRLTSNNSVDCFDNLV